MLINSKTILLNYIRSHSTKVVDLNIYLNQSSINELNREKKLFSKATVLEKDSAKWVDVKVKTKHIETKGKIKLKGMFLDDFERVNFNFSYKLKIKTPLLNLLSFNLHYPEKRLKLYEWYGDNLLAFGNLLHHKNHFVNLKINEKDMGIFLLEEKNNKQMLKNNSRKVGPIIFFSKHHLRRTKAENFSESYYSSKILAQFKHPDNGRAIELLDKYRKGILKPKEVFNIKKVSKLFAISEFIGYVHHLQFHNIQFYYNNEIDKLEIIANDFMFDDIKKWTPELFCLSMIKRAKNSFELPWATQLLKDDYFVNQVLYNIREIVDSNFLEKFKLEIYEKEKPANIIMSKFDYLYIPDVFEKLNRNSKHIEYILNSSSNIDFSIFNDEKNNTNYFSVKNGSYFAICPKRIYIGDSLIYTFDPAIFINAKTFGEILQTNNIIMKNFNAPSNQLYTIEYLQSGNKELLKKTF